MSLEKNRAFGRKLTIIVIKEQEQGYTRQGLEMHREIVGHVSSMVHASQLAASFDQLLKPAGKMLFNGPFRVTGEEVHIGKV
jgi:hypothetical protein